MAVDVINLLPETIANQIAAGEVIQRPASVVKELMENSIDAGASHIVVNIKEAGKTLIQVIDDGCGMSDTDARMCFERHATSKINKVDDLFRITTMGFRGEALASIASIARVELKTRRDEDELGTFVVVEGGEVKEQSKVSCAKGSNFSVKNLFYNVPARRKFLRKDTTEFGFILFEVQKVAIAYPNIRIELFHNDKQVYDLPKGNLARRIASVFGDKFIKGILPIEINLQNGLRIWGYIGKPEMAKKRSEQFFFVNKRYFRHSWFHRAVVETYEGLIREGTMPPYFIFYDIDPSRIDVNIHPTKTEIKFEDEVNIRRYLMSAVKNTLYKYNIFPSLDFDKVIDFENNTEKDNFKVRRYTDIHNDEKNRPVQGTRQHKINIMPDVEEFMKKTYLEKVEMDEDENEGHLIIESSVNETTNQIEINPTFDYIIYRNRYVLMEVKSGLLVIDGLRALELLNYQKILETVKLYDIKSQYVLEPLFTGVVIKNTAFFEDFKEVVLKYGYELDLLNGEMIIKSYPAILSVQEAPKILIDIFYAFEEVGSLEDENLLHERLALQWAKTSSVITNLTSMDKEQVLQMVQSLLSQTENAVFQNNKVMEILSNDVIVDLFN